MTGHNMQNANLGGKPHHHPITKPPQPAMPTRPQPAMPTAANQPSPQNIPEGWFGYENVSRSMGTCMPCTGGPGKLGINQNDSRGLRRDFWGFQVYADPNDPTKMIDATAGSNCNQPFCNMGCGESCNNVANDNQPSEQCRRSSFYTDFRPGAQSGSFDYLMRHHKFGGDQYWSRA